MQMKLKSLLTALAIAGTVLVGGATLAVAQETTEQPSTGATEESSTSDSPSVGTDRPSREDCEKDGSEASSDDAEASESATT
jgi:hypothetical protein